MKIRLIKFVKNIDFTEKYLIIDFDGKRNTSSLILAELVALGLQIVSYHLQSMTLEEICVSILGEERRIG